MNYFSILSMITFLTYFIMGTYVYVINRKSSIHILFALICLCYSIWSFCGIFYYSAENTEALLLWLRLASFGYTIVYALTLHFFIILTGVSVHRIFLWLLYLPALFFLFLTSLFEFTVEHAVKSGNIWTFTWNYSSHWFIIYLLFCVVCLITSMGIILSWWGRTRISKERHQAKILFTTLFITFVITMLDVLILPIFTSYRSIAIIPVYTLAWAFGITYSIVRFRFLSLTPELVSREILSSIDELIILLDQKGEVITVNEKTNVLLQKDVVTRNELRECIVNYGELEKRIGDLLIGRSKDFSYRVRLKVKESTIILLDSRFSLVRDKFDDVLGVLVIGKEVKGIEQLKRIYRITDREFDIILQIISGSTNREIADDLGITLNTMKRHITNIYNKLAIYNKVQLMNLVKSFDIIGEE